MVTEWFETFKKDDFARSGNTVHEDFVLPEGPIMMGEEPAPHSLEPQFRKLGLSTYLIKGVPSLKAPHTVCKKGDALNANQVQLLKLFVKPMATVSGPLILSRQRHTLRERMLICARHPRAVPNHPASGRAAHEWRGLRRLKGRVESLCRQCEGSGA